MIRDLTDRHQFDFKRICLFLIRIIGKRIYVVGIVYKTNHIVAVI